MFHGRGGGYNRFTLWRVGLIFLAAGVWFAGVLTGRELLTGSAIGLLLLGLLLGILGRRDAD